MADFIQTPSDPHVPPPCIITHFEVHPPCKSMKSHSLRVLQVHILTKTLSHDTFIQTPPYPHVPPTCKITHVPLPCIITHFKVPPPCKSMNRPVCEYSRFTSSRKHFDLTHFIQTPPHPHVPPPCKITICSSTLYNHTFQGSSTL